MFDLEQQITHWKSHFVGVVVLPPDAIAELEAHLRDAYADLLQAGLAPHEAFRIAVDRLGMPAAVEDEFARSMSPFLRQRLPLSATALLACSVFALSAWIMWACGVTVHAGFMPGVVIGGIGAWAVAELLLPLKRHQRHRHNTSQPHVSKPFLTY